MVIAPSTVGSTTSRSIVCFPLSPLLLLPASVPTGVSVVAVPPPAILLLVFELGTEGVVNVEKVEGCVRLADDKGAANVAEDDTAASHPSTLNWEILLLV